MSDDCYCGFCNVEILDCNFKRVDDMIMCEDCFYERIYDDSKSTYLKLKLIDELTKQCQNAFMEIIQNGSNP